VPGALSRDAVDRSHSPGSDVSPRELGPSHRCLLNADHLIVDLPDSVAAYDASLGKSTRRTIRGYSNRLRRDFPDVGSEVIVPGDRAEQLVKQLVEWKIERFRRCGRTTYWETEAGRAGRHTTLAARCCEAHVTSIAGRQVAIHLVCRMGDGVVALEGASDPANEPYRLGSLSMYWVVCDAVARGARRLNAFTGSPNAKVLLGARARLRRSPGGGASPTTGVPGTSPAGRSGRQGGRPRAAARRRRGRPPYEPRCISG
jgi:hypothetical protein